MVYRHYAKPLIYLSDYDLCLQDRRGGWICLFRETPKARPYEVRYFDDLLDVLNYKYDREVVWFSATENEVCVKLENEQVFCHSDEL